MAHVFLVGPLGWPSIIETITGSNVAQQTVDLPGVMPGPTGQAFPFAEIKEGALTSAVALDLTAQQFDAMSFFAATLGARPVPHYGTAGETSISGIVFVRETQSAPEDVEDWRTTWGDIAVEAAREIMGYHGRLEPGALSWRMPMILSRALARTSAGSNAKKPSLRRNTNAEEVKVHATHAPHEGFFLTRTYDLQHPRFDGSQSARLSREVFVSADAVIVLPYDPVRDRVLLVEQFRMGPFGRGDPYPWVLEPVAGRVDAGETTEAAARRECEEEAGLTLRHLEHVNSHYFSPGTSTEYYHCYVALADLPDDAAGAGGLASEHEDIRTHILSFDEATQLIKTGEANIGPMILLMLWLERERTRLRSLA